MDHPWLKLQRDGVPALWAIQFPRFLRDAQFLPALRTLNDNSGHEFPFLTHYLDARGHLQLPKLLNVFVGIAVVTNKSNRILPFSF